LGALYKDDVKALKIPLPPLPEQKAIAQVLSTADAAILTTEKLIAKKELRKKWLMQQLLTGKKRLKGFSEEWKEMSLGEMFCERNETQYYDLPLLSIGQNGVYPQDESVKKDTSNEDKSKYKRICPGDIGYNTMRMWQGRSALSELEGIVSPAYTVVTPKNNADSIFFSYLFKMPKMTNLFWRNSQGLVDDTLNCKYKDFSIVKFFLPQTKAEQTAIAHVLQAADKEISLLKAKAEKLREQKKGLMQQLLTGKVRLKIN
jgi:type I restriction enzyme S subunit